MTQYQTLIMYPMSATALILGKRLLHEGHSLSLFCPTEVTKRLAHTIAADLEVEALDLASDVVVVYLVEEEAMRNFVKRFGEIQSPTLRMQWKPSCSYTSANVGHGRRV